MFRSRGSNAVLALVTIFSIGLSSGSAHAAGDAAKGEKVFNRCKTCHAVGDGAKNRTGPVLTSVYGGPAGAVEGYKYSASLSPAAEQGLVWNEENLIGWLANPTGFLKEKLGDDAARSKMVLRVTNTDDAKDVIAYLASFTGEKSASVEAKPAGSGKAAAAQSNEESESVIVDGRELAVALEGPGNLFEEDNSLPQPGDDDYEIAEYSTQEDLAYMKKVIAAMKEKNLWDGPNAIQVPVYPGTRPHGIILGTIFTRAEIEGHDGELIVKRSFEHPMAETNTPVALKEVQENPDKYLHNYAIMYRREAGYQDAHNNWYYAEFTPKGEAINYEGNLLVGRNDLCISCHVLAKGEDYFFTTDGIK